MADEQQSAPGGDDVAEAADVLGLGAQPPAPANPPGMADEWRGTANEHEAESGGPSDAEDEPGDQREEPDDRLSEAEVAVALTRPDEYRAYLEQMDAEAAADEEIEALQSGQR